MTPFRANPFDAGSTLVAWGVLGFALAVFLIFQSLEKPTPASVPSVSPSPATQLTLEQLPIREKIQPEIQPKPEEIPEPEPEEIPEPESEVITEPQPEVITEPQPEVAVIEEPPSPDEPKAAPEPKPIPEPVAVAQKASTVEGGGNPVSPSLIYELQRMVEKAKFYPSRARRANITGLAVLRLTISPSGIIQKAEILAAEHPLLAAGAKKTGARLVGKSISASPPRTIEIEIPIRYELH